MSRKESPRRFSETRKWAQKTINHILWQAGIKGGRQVMADVDNDNDYARRRTQGLERREKEECHIRQIKPVAGKERVVRK
jgi:hypothetical protein